MIDTTGFKEIHADKVQEERKKEIERKQEFIGSIKIKPGQTLFEVNLKEHTVEPAEFEETEIASYEQEVNHKPKQLGIVHFKNGHRKVMIDNLETRSKKLIKQPDCIYIAALNKKNLYKKLVKRDVIKIVKK